MLRFEYFNLAKSYQQVSESQVKWNLKRGLGIKNSISRDALHGITQNPGCKEHKQSAKGWQSFCQRHPFISIQDKMSYNSLKEYNLTFPFFFFLVKILPTTFSNEYKLKLKRIKLRIELHSVHLLAAFLSKNVYFI